MIAIGRGETQALVAVAEHGAAHLRTAVLSEKYQWPEEGGEITHRLPPRRNRKWFSSSILAWRLSWLTVRLGAGWWR